MDFTKAQRTAQLDKEPQIASGSNDPLTLSWDGGAKNISLIDQEMF